MDALGRLVEPEQFGDIIVKVDQGLPVAAGRRGRGAGAGRAGLPNPGLANPLKAVPSPAGC